MKTLWYLWVSNSLNELINTATNKLRLKYTSGFPYKNYRRKGKRDSALRAQRVLADTRRFYDGSSERLQPAMA